MMILWTGILKSLIEIIKMIDDPEVRASLQKIYDELVAWMEANKTKVFPPNKSVLPNDGV